MSIEQAIENTLLAIDEIAHDFTDCGLPSKCTPPDEVWDRMRRAVRDNLALPTTEERANALYLIAKERQRQINEEGWTEQMDDRQVGGSLADAAACYAMNTVSRQFIEFKLWPYHKKHWKSTPNDRMRELAKAGALLVAEMERLQRMAEEEKA